MTDAAGYLRASTDVALRAFDITTATMKRAVTVLNHARKARRERRALAQLDDRMLKDIGLTRSEAFREANRDIFDLPKPRSSRTFRW